MSADNIIGSALPQALNLADPPRCVLHRPFSWHAIPMRHTAWDSAEFAGRVRDVAAGTSDVLAFLDRVELDAGLAEADGTALPRPVSPGVAGNLMRLCITALALLASDTDHHLDALARKGVTA